MAYPYAVGSATSSTASYSGSPYGDTGAPAAAEAPPAPDYGPFFSAIGVKSWSLLGDGQMTLVFERAADVDRLKAAICKTLPRTCAKELERVDAEYGEYHCYGNTAAIKLQFETPHGADDCEKAVAESVRGWASLSRFHPRIVQVNVIATGDGTDGFGHLELVYERLRPHLGVKFDQLKKFAAQPPTESAATSSYQGTGAAASSGAYNGGPADYKGQY